VDDEPAPGELAGVLDDRVRRADIDAHDLLELVRKRAVELADVDLGGRSVNEG
jgi:hypothetical protein